MSSLSSPKLRSSKRTPSSNRLFARAPSPNLTRDRSEYFGDESNKFGTISRSQSPASKSAADTLSLIHNKRLGADGEEREGTDIWGFLYDPKIAKTKKSEIVVVMDPIEDMIVRLEGFLLKKSDKIMIVKTTKRHWFVFDIRDDSQKLSYYADRGLKKPVGSISLKEVYDIRRTQNFCEFELATPSRVITLQADSEPDMMKWINLLSIYFGVQDIESDDSDDDDALEKFEITNGTVENSKKVVNFQKADLSRSDETNTFLRFPFSSADRILLRDVQTSVQELPIHSHFLQVYPHPEPKNRPLLCLQVEFLDAQKKPVTIKAAHFDRQVGQGGLLYYLEVLVENQGEQTSLTRLTAPSLWFLLRLCTVSEQSELLYWDNIEPGCENLFGIHEQKCKNCRLSRPCDSPFKSISASGTLVTLNFLCNFRSLTPSQEIRPGFLHAMVLNRKTEGYLSSGFFVSREGDPPLDSVNKVTVQDQAAISSILDVTSKRQSLSFDQYRKSIAVFSNSFEFYFKQGKLQLESLKQSSFDLRIQDILLQCDATISSCIDTLGKKIPDDVAIRFLNAKEEENDRMSRWEIRQEVAILALRLFEKGVRPKDRILLSYSPSLHYFRMLAACLSFGAIAIPSPLPFPRNHVNLILNIIKLANPALCATDSTTYHYAISISPDVDWIATDSLPKNKEGLSEALSKFAAFLNKREMGSFPVDFTLDDIVDRYWELVNGYVQPQDTAVLQFGASSTENNRGLVITHKSFLYSSEIQARSLELESGETPVIVCWGYQYHHMQMGNLIFCMTHKSSLITFSPFDFMSNPILCWRVVTHYRATHVIGSNYGFILSSKIPSEFLQGIDLSSLQYCVSMSELPRLQTVNDFTEKFCRVGFLPSIWTLAYGTQEAHFISIRKGEPEVVYLDGKELMNRRVEKAKGYGVPRVPAFSFGKPQGLRVAVVDPDTSLPLSGKIGEVWVGGDSVCTTFYSSRMLASSSFGTRLALDDDCPECLKEFQNVNFLRTGDLGYYDEGELYIVGRLRDTIIIQGREYHPSEIEDIVANAIGILQKGSVVALCITDSEREDQLALLAEVSSELDKEDLQSGVSFIRDVIQRHIQVTPEYVVLCATNSLPKGPNLQCQRPLIKQQFLDKKLDGIIFQSIWSEVSQEVSVGSFEATHSRFNPSEAIRKEWVNSLIQSSQKRNGAVTSRFREKDQIDLLSLETIEVPEGPVIVLSLSFQDSDNPFLIPLLKFAQTTFSSQAELLHCQIPFHESIDETDESLTVVRVHPSGAIEPFGPSVKLLHRHLNTQNPAVILIVLTGKPHMKNFSAIHNSTSQMVSLLNLLLRESLPADFLYLINAFDSHEPAENFGSLDPGSVALSMGESFLRTKRTKPFLALDLKGSVDLKLLGPLLRRSVSGTGIVSFDPSLTSWLNWKYTSVSPPQLSLSSSFFDFFGDRKSSVDVTCQIMAPELKQTSVNVKVAPSMVVEEVQRTLLRKLQQTFSPEENELVSSFDFVIPGTEMILSSSEMIGSYEVVFSGLPHANISLLLCPPGSRRSARQMSLGLKSAIHYVREQWKKSSVGVTPIDELSCPIAEWIQPKVVEQENTQGEPPKIAVLGSDVGAIEAALSLEERGYSVTLFPQWSGAPDFECLGPETSSSLTTATQCAEVTFQGKSWDAGTFMTSEKHIGWLKDDAALLQSIVWGKGSKGSTQLDHAREFALLIPVTNISSNDAEKPGMHELSHLLKEGNLSVSEWSKRHGLQSFINNFVMEMACRGSGFPEELPVIYLMKFLCIENLAALKNGTMASYWTNQLARLRDVNQGVTVQQIQRSPNSVELTLASGERQKFDQVIIGSRKWADVLGRLDCNPEEKFCLSSVQYNSRYVCLCSVQPQNLDDWILPNTVAHFQENQNRVGFPTMVSRISSSNVLQIVAYGNAISKSDFEKNVQMFLKSMDRLIVKIHTIFNYPYAAPYFSPSLVDQEIFEKLERLQGLNGLFFTGSVVATEEMHLQVQHARQLVKSHFPDRSLSCEKMFKRSKAIQGLVPQSCVVYGGLYGVGFKLVRELCLSGSQRVIILSPLPLSMLSKERFDLLQGLSGDCEILFKYLHTDREEELLKGLEFLNPALDHLNAFFFVQEDHTVVSSTHAGVQTFRSLLHQKFLTAQVLDQWLLERQENLPLTIISVLSSDCDGLYVTPSNASHDSFEQILERRLEKRLPCKWIRFASSSYQEIAQLLALHSYPVNGIYSVANTWHEVEKREVRRRGTQTESYSGDLVVERGRAATLQPAGLGPVINQAQVNAFEKPQVTRANEIMEKAAEVTSPEKLNFMLDQFKEIVAKHGSFSKSVSIPLEELIDLQLRDLDLSSIELVNLKESITDYMNVYVPASKILSVESIGDFVHVILDHISTQNDSGTLEALHGEITKIFYENVSQSTGVPLDVRGHDRLFAKKKLCQTGMTAVEFMDVKEAISDNLGVVIPAGQLAFKMLSIEAFLLMICRQAVGYPKKRKEQKVKVPAKQKGGSTLTVTPARAVSAGPSGGRKKTTPHQLRAKLSPPTKKGSLRQKSPKRPSIVNKPKSSTSVNLSDHMSILKGMKQDKDKGEKQTIRQQLSKK